MKILAHRGYWNSDIPNNSMEALQTALDRGFGFESDIRDYDGRLVISHNIADSLSPFADAIFEKMHQHSDQYCFAINIKADGLKELLTKLLYQYDIKNYFTFDMSVPQMIEFREMGIRYFTRESEVETVPVMYEDAAGVWIDGFFDTNWITEDLLRKHIANGKEVCIVSPELHKREYIDFWKRLYSFDLDFSKVMLCTDLPDEAKLFFGGIV